VASNRAVTDDTKTITPRVVVPPDAKVEGLPANGAMAKYPAWVIGAIMFLANFIVKYAVDQGYMPALPSDMRAFADQWGTQAAAIAAAALWSAPALIQAAWNARRMFAPRSVYKRYVVPLFHKG
jgi:hypothetical protein